MEALLRELINSEASKGVAPLDACQEGGRRFDENPFVNVLDLQTKLKKEHEDQAKHFEELFGHLVLALEKLEKNPANVGKSPLQILVPSPPIGHVAHDAFIIYLLAKNLSAEMKQNRHEYDVSKFYYQRQCNEQSFLKDVIHSLQWKGAEDEKTLRDASAIKEAALLKALEEYDAKVVSIQKEAEVRVKTASENLTLNTLKVAQQSENLRLLEEACEASSGAEIFMPVRCNNVGIGGVRANCVTSSDEI